MRPPLEVMVRDRGEGKTTETIKWLLEPTLLGHDSPYRIMLCVDEHRAEWVRREYPFVKHLVYTVRSWDGGRGRGHDIEVALEDAEALIYDAVGPYNLTRITISGISI